MIVECTACNTIFPVDPKKVPAGGVHARCSVCSEVFFVSVPEPEAAPTMAETVPEVDVGYSGDTLTEAPSKEAAPAVEEEPGWVEPAPAFQDTEMVPEFSEPGFQETTLDLEDTKEVLQETAPTFDEPAPTFDEPAWTEEDTSPTFQEAEVMLGEGPEPVFEELSEVPGDVADEFAEEVAEEAWGPEEVEEAAPPTAQEPPEEPVGTPAPTPAPLFGKRDPMEKAQRLARVLVSDIILYNPDRHHMATESGRVREEFQDEIQKSWDEYVEQVGEEIANTTDFFTEALNEILAKGQRIF
jgi:predicted Zn finger-like uncharacterized protein